MKKITLTDKDGIRFEIEVETIKCVVSNGSTVQLIHGEQINVKESLERVLRKVVKG